MVCPVKKSTFEVALGSNAVAVFGISPTITSTSANDKIISNLKIRKLTPKECWRLMGFDDKDFDRAEKVNSNTQLYKQARKFYRCKCS